MKEKIDNEQRQTIGELGRRFSDVTIRMHESIAQNAGLTGTDHKYLGLLIKNGAMTAGELSQMTGLTTGAITGLMDRLEAKDLVQRQFDKNDRRKIIIQPNTEQVAKLFGPVSSELQIKISSLIAGFSENEKTVIQQYLLGAMEVMEEITNNLKNK